ncbi:39S ribosomal protein L32, mitochondrial [Bombina bombina]|uniref:39S ribosomal protein L32, mitochondrial n=1 Tax=Bombina bombina TaxID=8345 RepID=UPI00235AD921|nr:39S ribosomal protein L32, mitochondrial [Bombina bombina]
MALSTGPVAGVLGLFVRCCLRVEQSVLLALGLQPPSPALAVQAPSSYSTEETNSADNETSPSFLDSIFWMAAPKSRRTIEVNRCRRRNPNKLVKEKNNIDVCLECGHLKLKHVLCPFCYEKVRHETHLIRDAIKEKEGGPFKAPTVESVVLYEGEKPRPEDEGKRILERNRKRPSWFTY